MAGRAPHPHPIMEPRPRFNLDQAVAAWRAELARHPGPAPADLRELEAHLREGFAELQKKDLSDEEAFLIARHRVGPSPAVAGEFAKRAPRPLWRSRGFWVTFLVVMGVFGGYALSLTPLYQATSTLDVIKTTSEVMDPTEFFNDYSLLEAPEIAQQVAAQMTPEQRRVFLAPFRDIDPSDTKANLVNRLIMQRHLRPSFETPIDSAEQFKINVSVWHPDQQIAAVVADDFDKAFVETQPTSNLAGQKPYQLVQSANGHAIQILSHTPQIMFWGFFSGLTAAFLATLLARLPSFLRRLPPPLEPVG